MVHWARWCFTSPVKGREQELNSSLMGNTLFGRCHNPAQACQPVYRLFISGFFRVHASLFFFPENKTRYSKTML